MFIIDVNYKKPLEEIDLNLEAHKKHLNKYYSEKIFICSGRKTPRTGGTILADNVTLDRLNEIIKEDPFYKFDLADFNVTEFIPSKLAEDFRFLKAYITEPSYN